MENNITVRISGGIGNQLFQFATARTLSLKYPSSKLVLDLSYYYDNLHNNFQYQLNDFCINTDFDIVTDNRFWKYGWYDNLLKRVFFKFFPKAFYSFYAKKNSFIWNGFDYMPFPEISGDAYINGFWQSEKYFIEFKDIILSEFSFKNKLPKQLINFSNSIQNSESVCVHVRLGDYLTIRDFFVCDSAYYKCAISYLNTKIVNPTYYIFSNDPELAKEMLQGIDGEFVFVSGNSAIDDMQLMSLCKHFIIANSSFSWWAQYFNQSPDKIVVSPKYWYKGICTGDVWMDDWIRL